ncbi:uncharacterized protein PAC_16453 [Phialocephala subalpina]|uniref:Uncharacterized protein n=1 Tax=Phialocephala subalpina TaxID=576137 RepID=A0A1L7XNE9_9HELO|nr:uncharacterized protein PAC_16453 [Phialocephala subalpina]
MRIPKSLAALGHVFLSLSTASTAQQQPLLDPSNEASSTSQWRFNFSSEAPHYFASVHGLLQQWSNTFFPNGHSIVPCEIAPFTKLYHGRMDGDVPPSPECGMAYGIMGGSRNSHMLTYQTTRRVKCIYFDGESATLFGSGQLDSQNLQIWGNISGPARPGNGFRGLYDEYARAAGLCDWFREQNLGGPGWGYEGIVRMNAGFEMIWCNFSSPSIRLISHLNITAPLLPEGGTNVMVTEQDNVSSASYCPLPLSERDTNVVVKGQEDVYPTSYYPLPPSPTRSDKATDPSDPPRPPVGGKPEWLREPFFPSQAWSWYMSATQHYGSNGDGPGRGETHVKPISCGFLTYYSPEFLSQAIPRAKEEQKSLNLTKEGLWAGPGEVGIRGKTLQALTRRRRLHDLQDITPSDAATMRQNSEKVLRDLLSDSPANCSGIEWTAMTNDIVQTYGSSLFNFLHALEKFENITVTNKTLLRGWMVDVRDQTHAFLLPFLEYPDEDASEDVWVRDSSLFKATYSRCRFQYTRLLDPEEGVSLGPEELLLKWAIEETTGGICSALVDIGLAVEGIWESNFNIPVNNTSESQMSTKLKSEVSRWTSGIEELMAWLGWAGEWVRCEERCAWDESCFIPMWPLIPFPRRRDGGGGGPGRGPPNNRPGYGGPPYGRPGYGRPYPYADFPSPPNNGSTGRRPSRGFNPWQSNEDDLWSPRCVKSDYILKGREA